MKMYKLLGEVNGIENSQEVFMNIKSYRTKHDLILREKREHFDFKLF